MLMWSCSRRPSREVKHREASATQVRVHLAAALGAQSGGSASRSREATGISGELRVQLSLHDICYSASARRSHHDYRLSCDRRFAATTYRRPRGFPAGRDSPRPVVRPQSFRRASRKLVFVFSGQGSQWFGMGRTLLHEEPVFREVIERCDAGAAAAYGDWSLIAELAATDAAESRLNEVDVIQPALFAIQVALAALWRSWGIEPDAVVGHSMGEVAAAYVAGALSLEDAALIICTRSKLVKRTVGQGAMAAVELSIEDARRAIAGYEDRVSIAVSTSPTSTVLSGDPAALADDTRTASGPRHLLPDGEGGLRLAQSADGSVARRADAARWKKCSRSLASIPIYSTVPDAVADGLGVRCALLGAQSQGAGAFFSVGAAPDRRRL